MKASGGAHVVSSRRWMFGLLGDAGQAATALGLLALEHPPRNSQKRIMRPIPINECVVRLSQLPRGTAAVVEDVESLQAGDSIAKRLRDLGFVNGEPVRVVALGPVGAEPLLVQIGYTRFALRRAEAARVRIRIEA